MAHRFAVSGWDDDANDIDEEKNPHDCPEKEILWAAENGNLEKVKSILELFPHTLNYQDSDGYTPLHRACYNNHLEVVDYLIINGADVCAKTNMGWHPLHCCCKWNHKEVALRLIQCGADINAYSDGKQTPLHIAASYGTCYDMVQLLLSQPEIKPDLTNNNGETAFDIAKRSSKYYNIFEMIDPILDVC